MDFTALTQQLIRAYLGDDVQSTRQVMEMVAEDIIVIGTGRQEIFRNRKEYIAALERELVQPGMRRPPHHPGGCAGNRPADYLWQRR